jgi:hypothetical protein
MHDRHAIRMQYLFLPGAKAMNKFLSFRPFVVLTACACVAALSSAPAHGQNIWVTSNVTTGGTNGLIGEYTMSGAAVNPAVVSGLSNPVAIVVSGSNIFVANQGNGTIGEYTTSGAVVNPSLITGLPGVWSLVLSGSNLFVASNGTSG